MRIIYLFRIISVIYEVLIEGIIKITTLIVIYVKIIILTRIIIILRTNKFNIMLNYELLRKEINQNLNYWYFTKSRRVIVLWVLKDFFWMLVSLSVVDIWRTNDRIKWVEKLYFWRYWVIDANKNDWWKSHSMKCHNFFNIFLKTP